MAILTERKKFRLDFTENVLGSWPADREIFTRFIATKAPYPWLDENDQDVIPDRTEATGMTVFPQDSNGLHIMNYHIKGFLKEAGNNLKGLLNIKNLRSKLDNYVFINPRRIYFHRPDGSLIEEPDDILERPLRGETMQGPRVSLVASEMIEAPVYVEFEIEILPNGSTEEEAEGKNGKKKKVKKAITDIAKSEINWDVIYELMDYGRLKGISQWRNGGFGTFEWKEISDLKLVKAV